MLASACPHRSSVCTSASNSCALHWSHSSTTSTPTCAPSLRSGVSSTTVKRGDSARRKASALPRPPSLKSATSASSCPRDRKLSLAHTVAEMPPSRPSPTSSAGSPSDAYTSHCKAPLGQGLATPPAVSTSANLAAGAHTQEVKAAPHVHGEN
eukprot:6187563-Pleurochrysis_carterae.AAC.4